MGPIHVTEDNLLYSESTGVNVNLIKNIFTVTLNRHVSKELKFCGIMNLKSQDCGESGFMESLQAEVSILQSYQVFSFVRDYA